MVLCRPTRSSRTNTKEACPLHHRGLECKSRKSRNTWSNRQIWPWSTKWSRAKANRVFPREHTGHSKHLLPTTQEKPLHMDITRRSIPKLDWLYSLQPKMEKLYTVSKIKTGSWLGSGSDHKLLIAKFRFKLKKVGNLWTIQVWLKSLTIIQWKWQIKGLDLLDRVPEELWMEFRDTSQEAVIKTIPKKKKCKKAKWLSEEAL